MFHQTKSNEMEKIIFSAADANATQRMGGNDKCFDNKYLQDKKN